MAPPWGCAGAFLAPVYLSAICHSGELGQVGFGAGFGLGSRFGAKSCHSIVFGGIDRGCTDEIRNNLDIYCDFIRPSSATRFDGFYPISLISELASCRGAARYLQSRWPQGALAESCAFQIRVVVGDESVNLWAISISKDEQAEPVRPKCPKS